MAEKSPTENSRSTNPNSTAAPAKSIGQKRPREDNNDNNEEGSESEAEMTYEDNQPDAQPAANLNCIPCPRKKCSPVV
ncbi:hypothetical protein FA15DRAFT_711829 [Coprinopsis marcescibilis]|uniref:Uncharacterized protein n=1 Tax=Coprinopsis marcescibilis TaxID=230819 RepID=A0A5C3K9B6_COPMA|nr:hypothetical protein FA15DRAFT_711829 [Coprinopsis marcescibilis]